MNLTETDLINYWDFERNTISPEALTYGSNYKAFWRCSKGHNWERLVKVQYRIGHCSQCVNKLLKLEVVKKAVSKTGLLKNEYPEIFKEWSPKNTIDPELISYKSQTNILWECSKCGFEWFYKPKYRVRGLGKCLACKDRVLIKGKNDLKTKNEYIASEWCYEQNGELTPEEVRYNQYIKVWWRCSKCSNLWSSTIADRTIGNRGCGSCYRSSKISKGQQEIFEFVKSNIDETVIMNAVGLEGSNLEIDIYSPKYNIGIEYNGDYWHSDRVTLARKNISARNYHENKLNICHKNGVNLCFVWESDWTERKDIAKNALLEYFNNGVANELLFTLDKNSFTIFKPIQKTSDKKLKNVRTFTEAEKFEIEARYLAGESAALIAEDLGKSKLKLFELVEENNWREYRIDLGLDSRGKACVPTNMVEEFKKDVNTLSMRKIFKKYGFNSKKYKVELERLSVSKTVEKES